MATGLLIAGSNIIKHRYRNRITVLLTVGCNSCGEGEQTTGKYNEHFSSYLKASHQKT
jgi:hypothetical protein